MELSAVNDQLVRDRYSAE